MADIQTYINNILNAVYGEEVRASLVNALAKINADNEKYLAIKQEVVKAKDTVVDQIVAFDEKHDKALQTIADLLKVASDAAVMQGELQTATNAAERKKGELDEAVNDATSKITDVIKVQDTLRATITTAVQTKEDLAASNAAGAQTKTDLDAAIKAANLVVEEIGNTLTKIDTTAEEQLTAIRNAGAEETEKVQQAAAEIVADRQQIQQNKKDAAALKEDIVGLDNRKADAIVETASGNPCNISDSSGLLIKKLNIYGESTQEGTPSPALPVPIISKEISKITVTGKELEKQETILSKPITLRGIPVESGGNVTIDGKQYVSDMICEHNGIISVERNVEKALLKKDIVFTQTKDNTYRCACFAAIIGGEKLKDGSGTSLSSCFPWVAWANSTIYDKDKTVFAVNEGGIYISLPRTGAEPSKEEAENRVNELWQSVKDKVEFYAQLKTPVYEPLPEADQDAIKNLYSYYPNTTIECGAWTEVEYVADTKEFFLNQNQSLQKQILEIQNALISQKISGGGYNPS